MTIPGSINLGTLMISSSIPAVRGAEYGDSSMESLKASRGTTINQAGFPVTPITPTYLGESLGTLLPRPIPNTPDLRHQRPGNSASGVLESKAWAPKAPAVSLPSIPRTSR